jgi:hypothetical protein
MFVRRLAGLGVLVLVGASALVPGAAQAQAAAHEVVLTNASNAKNVEVQRGEEVLVQLTGSAGTGRVGQGTEFTWSLPVLSRSGVLELKSESQDGIHTTALYAAVHDGATTISSTEGCKILTPRHACPMFLLLWRAGVTVSS